MDCVGALVYPFIPGVKPEDLSGAVLDEGSDIADTAAEHAEDTAKAIRDAYRLGAGKTKMRQAVARANKNARNLRVFSWVLKGIGYASAAQDSYDNFMNCELKP